MKAAILYTLLIMLCCSCRTNEGAPNAHYQSSLNKKMANELIIEANGLEQRANDVQGIPSYYLADSALLEKTQKALIQTLKNECHRPFVDSLEITMLTELNKHNPPKKNYFIDFDPFGLSHANPTDTAIFQKLHDLFQRCRQSTVPAVRQIIVLQGYALFLEKLHDKTHPGFCCFCYWRIEPFIYAPQKIWRQNEPAYVIHLTAEFDRNYNHIRFNGQEYKSPFTLNAPAQKGLHEITGEIGVKERGKMVWMPFSHRIWVE